MKKQTLGNLGVYRRILEGVSDHQTLWVRDENGQMYSIGDVHITTEGVILDFFDKEDIDRSTGLPGRSMYES